jgi:hypothetical protein
MSYDFQSLIQFKGNLNEVHELVKYAARNERNNLRYKTFNKSAILLLTSKLELFLQDVLVEFIDSINELNLTTKEIPDGIKLQHSLNQLTLIVNNKNHFHKSSEICEKLKGISPIWGTQNIYFNSINIDFRFDYGKHGEKEIIKLFQRIGTDNIFNVITVYQYKSGKKVKIDIKGKLNSIVAIRNNIIHEDATPSLTHIQVREFVTLMKSFANEILNYLQKKKNNLSIVN